MLNDLTGAMPDGWSIFGEGSGMTGDWSLDEQVLDDIGRSREDLTSDEERFLEKVEKVDSCWEWDAYKSDEYGRFRYESENVLEMRAHRVSMAIFDELDLATEEETVVRHRCPRGSKSCVRPDHLALGTRSDNRQDTLLDGGGRLDPAEVVELRRRYREEDETTYQGLADEYDISIETAHGVINGRYYSCIEEGLDFDE